MDGPPPSSTARPRRPSSYARVVVLTVFAAGALLCAGVLGTVWWGVRDAWTAFRGGERVDTRIVVRPDDVAIARLTAPVSDPGVRAIVDRWIEAIDASDGEPQGEDGTSPVP